MFRWLSALMLVVPLAAHAHLNHVQFAAIEESGGKLHVRYRMSADMFMTTLDLDIKGGRIDASVKSLPVDQIIARYFATHLQLETKAAAQSAASVSFSADLRSGDWIAEFVFDLPSADARLTLFCDAFLDNNPRTQTLGRINWRGEKTVFHFRKGNERYVLGSSQIGPAAVQSESDSTAKQFISAFAEALRDYVWLAVAAIGLCVAQVFGKHRWRWMILFAGVIAAVALRGQIIWSGYGGFLVGWLIVVLTAQRVLFNLTRGVRGHA